MDTEKLQKRIVAILEQTNAEVAEIASKSQGEWVARMMPGDVRPDFGEHDIPTAEGRREKEAAVAAAVDAVLAAIDSEHAGFLRWVTDCPSPEDTTAVRLAVSRESVGEAELQALHDRYGSSYALDALIMERAARDGIHLDGSLPKGDAEGAKAVARGEVGAAYADTLVPADAAMAFIAAGVADVYENGRDEQVVDQLYVPRDVTAASMGVQLGTV